MCGIAGIYMKGGGVERETIERMTRTLAHRGPDSEGFYVSDQVGLGARRLRIIDLASGDQPIYNEDRRLAVVFNGEIYNFRELRAELEAKGHRFTTASDTEVIPHLYEEEGVDAVKRLNGMFAFALWDARERALLLARDHLGIKPLYYARQGDALLFGSELKAVLAAWSGPREIDPQALDAFLTFRYVPAPRTIFRGIQKLPPGHYLHLRGDEVKVRRFWDMDFLPAERDEAKERGEEEWTPRLHHLLSEAVRMQMVADVSIGAFLSGGLDSSIVVGLMAQHSERPVKTYTVGFRGWSDYDEREHARLVARHFSTEHHEVEVEAKAAELLPDLVAHFDEPMADPAAIPTFLMCREARREVTVVLTGEGADELFAGYGWYSWAHPRLFPSLAQRLPWPLQRGLLRGVERAFRGRRGKRTLMAALIPDFKEQYLETVAGTVFQNIERGLLYTEAMRQELGGNDSEIDWAYYLAHSAGYSPQGRMQYLDTKVWLADDPLTKVDRMSMAVSLEARVPFLDYRLAELAAQMPAALKWKDGVGKHILRRAMADLLPASILNRPKHAFDVPVSQWLRGELRGQVEALPDHEAIRESPYLRPERVAELARAHLSGRGDYGMQLWALLNFALWHATYLGSNSDA